MIGLHVLWTLDSELCVWGEQSALPARARGRPGRPPATPRPRPHPFACGAGLVSDALARIGATAAATRRRERRLALLAAVVDARASGVPAPAAHRRGRRTARPALAARCVGGRRGCVGARRGGRSAALAAGHAAGRCGCRRVGPVPRRGVQAGARAGGARAVAPRARAPRRAVGRPLAARDRRRRRRPARRPARRLDAAAPARRAVPAGGGQPARGDPWRLPRGGRRRLRAGAAARASR